MNVLIVAGEASGDLHGGRLLEELNHELSGLQAFGLGGPRLKDAGMEILADSSEISVVGIIEALRIVPRARQIFRQLLREVDSRQTKLAILIDFPEFNLRLAKSLKKKGVKVVYYISPQVWAWRKRRVHTVAQVVDRMLVVLPFELDFYRQHGVDATHVGHPLVDEVPPASQLRDMFREHDHTRNRIVLLPGSRSSEIESNLPVMLEAVQLLSLRLSIDVKIIKATTIDTLILQERLADCSVPTTVIGENRFESIANADLAICASGTATLEVGLIGTPMIVMYRVRPWTFLLGRLLVRLPYISLVNLVLGKEVVPELLQDNANPAEISNLAAGLLADQDKMDQIRTDLGGLRGRLGESGASRRAAREVLELLAPRNVT